MSNELISTMVCDAIEKELGNRESEECGESEDTNSFVPRIPTQVEKNLDAICYSDDGQLFLSSSCLTGRHWTGSVWCWNKPEQALDLTSCTAGIDIQTGIADMCYIGSNKIITGEDSGGVEFIELVNLENCTYFNSRICIVEHDDSVSTVACNSDRALVASGGADCSIKIWDVDSEDSRNSLLQVHNAGVTSVVFSSTSPQIMLSSSMDGRTILWDFRLSTPALTCSNFSQDNPLALDWEPNSEYKFACGFESGNVLILDIRGSESVVKKFVGHERPIHRVRFSPQSSNLLATCADNTVLKVFDTGSETCDIIYEDASHSDFIRGIAWSPVSRQLSSCGWDKQVLHHSIPV